MYQAFGYSIHSEIPLPELQKIHPSEPADADIHILYADLSERWTAHSCPAQKWVSTDQLVMFQVPELAIFASENGNRILISPDTYADEDKLRLYILGSCMGALLFQRKILPLHGSAIAINGKAFAFVGHSGHGKSTLASALMQLGYSLITDDVIAVSLDDADKPFVTPAYPQQKLWQESLDNFGMDSSQYRPLFERETKFAVPVQAHFEQETLPLAGIFELVKSDCSEVQLRTVDKLERLPLLFRHTYRKSLLAGNGLTSWHFDITARMSGNLPIYQLQRPLYERTVHQLADLVLSMIETP
ncbi:aldolase [Paenibacillus lemnae]|uniref:Aldolase n=1 Tax=Paenibacillus lemnae TaxID=1330551 RepID=A0A848M620_PAELE|nr:aldolase [Paenibacillus lemnae]NMO95699.1 aldolase [Paenibacillus lemnae]